MTGDMDRTIVVTGSRVKGGDRHLLSSGWRVRAWHQSEEREGASDIRSRKRSFKGMASQTAVPVFEVRMVLQCANPV
jgi:hypothetical protein